MTTTTRHTTAERSTEGALPAAAGLLRVVLRANAVTSVLTGMIGAVAADRVADAIGAGEVGLTRFVAIGLIGFAAFVAWASSLPSDRLRGVTLLISMGDLAWVAATIAVLTAGALNTTGTVLAVLIGGMVLDFGLTQLWLRRRLG